jgi:hypothetical protein
VSTARLSRREGPRPALGQDRLLLNRGVSGSIRNQDQGWGYRGSLISGSQARWDARKKARSQKPVFLQRVSITIAKGDSRVLDSMRHDRQSVTAPDLVGH